MIRTKPIVEYTQILVNGKSIHLEDTGNVSFNPGFNQVTIKFKCTNDSPIYHEVRITPAEIGGIVYDENSYDIGIGTRPTVHTSMSQNVEYTDNITVNATYFNQGDRVYRVGLYTKGSNNIWDVVYMFFTVDTRKFVPDDDPALYVLTDKPIPVQ